LPSGLRNERRSRRNFGLDLVTVVSKVCGVPHVNPRSPPPRV